MSLVEIDSLKRRLQGHFSDGLVTVVGSGLSCAEGLPGMGALSAHLKVHVPPLLDKGEQANWDLIAASLDKIGLEATLLQHSASEQIEGAISDLTTELIVEHERRVVEDVFSSGRILRFTRLAERFLRSERPIPVITTNYDRLIEVASEEAGLGVETMFVGDFAGRLDPKANRLSFCEDIRLGPNKTVQTQFRKRVSIFKPHGSLDWYHRYGKPVRYGGDLAIPRLIITPGSRKFRSGYDSPFDINRDRANSEIDNASRFLVIGYGFNDDHLETHLTPRISMGAETILLTHSLTPNAENVVRANSNVTALTYGEAGPTTGTTVWNGSVKTFYADINLWDVAAFVDEVFK